MNSSNSNGQYTKLQMQVKSLRLKYSEIQKLTKVFFD